MFPNSLQSLYIVLTSFYWTALTLAYTLSLAFLNKSSRARADKMIQRWSAALLNVATIRRTRTEHAPLEIKPGRSYMVMCTHSSLYDIPISFEALAGHSVRMLTKKELSKIPFFGSSLVHNEFIYVDRHNREAAMQDLKDAQTKMEDGVVLWVAPEGTRSKNGELLPFKKGVFHLAMETEAIIIPIAIQGAHKILPLNSINVNLDTTVNVHIGAPIDSKGYARDGLMKTVRASIQHLLTAKTP